MAPPPMEVDVTGVDNVVRQWSADGERLSALHFPEFAGVAASGSAVAAALRSMAEPAEQSCGDIGNRLTSLAGSAGTFLESVLRHDSFLVSPVPAPR